MQGQDVEVPMSNVISKSTHEAASPDQWYVMCHKNPSWIETMLQKDSRGLMQPSGEQPLPPYRFYIPWLYMPRVSASASSASDASGRHYDPVGDDASLRNDLRQFVFIQASPERIAAIVQSDWNRQARHWLYHYRDACGTKVTISDAEMHRFILTMQDHHLQFFLDQPLSEFSVGDKVILQMEPWVGRLAEIKTVRVHRDRISFTVSLNIFNRTKSINFPDVSVGDVQFVDEEKGRLLSGNPIDNYEEEIIDLLSHRFTSKCSEPVVETDRQRLKRLASYTRIFVDDASEQARFTALKLLCAYLRSDRARVAAYTDEVLSILAQQPVPPANYTTAYLTMALFITTRNPRYRDAVKAYCQSHPDRSVTLRRYHRIVKGIKPRKPKA